MADSKISALTELATAPAAGDLLVLVDVSDTTMAASGTDKKITFTNLTGTFLTSSTGLLATGATTGATSQAQEFSNASTPLVARRTGLSSDAFFTAINIIAQKTTNMGDGFGPSAAFLIRDDAGVDNPIGALGFVRSGADNTGAYRVSVYQAGSSTQISEWTQAQFTLGGTSNLDRKIVLPSGTGGANTATFQFGTVNRDWTMVVAASPYTWSLNYTGTDAPVSNALVALKSGYVGVGVATPTALLHVAASSTTRASVCVVAGTAPTTPVVGDIWNDGALSFYNADATTNAVVNHLRLSRDSTGTPAAGLGLGILAELESTTTSRQSAGRLTWEWATATHASRAVKGKLTAYYTSTEREAITWVADSSSARVGIMNAAPAAMLHVGAGADSPTISETIGYFSNAGTTAIAVRDSTNDAEAVMYISSSGAIYGTMTSHPVYFRTANNDVLSILANGNVGIGVTSPQGKLHGYDGSGGFLFVNQATVGGTLVTVIPDAAGDVTEKIFFVGWCTNSAPFSADVAPTTLAVSSSTTKTDGTNTLTIAVTAGGAFTLQATGGAATWNVNLWVFWR